jgi:integrase
MASSSITKRTDLKPSSRKQKEWRARYRDHDNREHAKTFHTKAEGQQWLADQVAALKAGTHIEPKHDRLTVAGWCADWLAHYSPESDGTKRQAAVHVKHITHPGYGIGHHQLAKLSPMHVEKWVGELRAAGLAPSYVRAVYNRLVQIMRAAVRSRRIARFDLLDKAPKAPEQRPYIAKDDHVWQLADAVPERLRIAVLVAAYAGLRDGELCGLRLADIDFDRFVITPAVQYPAKPLKTVESAWPVPVPEWLIREIGMHIDAGHASEHLLTNQWGQQAAPWLLQRAIREARAKVEDLPDDFRLHDLRHFYISVLIEKGLNIKVVQACARHAKATTTLDVYGHLFDKADERTRAALDGEYRPRLAVVS